MSRIRIVKGKYTKIVGGNYNIYSASNIITTAGEQIIETAGEGIFYGEPELPPVAEIDILADAIVHFRPMNDWKGRDYGFDWMRIDDTGLFGDKKMYSEIVGTYSKYPKGEETSSLIKNQGMYDSLKKEYCNPVYKIPWLLKDKKPVDYFASWLSVETGKEITLSLGVQLKDKKNPPKELVISYDKTICEITSKLGKGVENDKLDFTKKNHFAKITIKNDDNYKLEDEIKIKILTDIITPQTLKVLCDGKDAGFLKLYPNKPKELKVLLVSVLASFAKKDEKEGKITGKEELIKILAQSCVKLQIEEVQLNISLNGDGTSNIDLYSNTILLGDKILFNGTVLYKNEPKKLLQYLDWKLKEKYEEKYQNYLRIFYVGKHALLDPNDEEGGGVGGQGYIGKDRQGEGRAIMYEGATPNDVAHEALHAMGLEHTFTSTDIPAIKTHAPYSYKYKATENIMDYSHLDGKTKYSTWKWQWDIIRKFRLLKDKE